MTWIRRKMMNPKGEIGVVINQAYGVFLVLTVEFEDKHTEELWLADLGPNPKETKGWKWLVSIEDGKEKWADW